MQADREAALRDLLTAIAGALAVPVADTTGDGRPDHQVMWYRGTEVAGYLRALASGPLDNVAVQAGPRSIKRIIASHPVTYRPYERQPGLPPAARGEAVRCDADWGSAIRSQRCTLPAGHGGNHVDGSGHAWGGTAIPCPGPAPRPAQGART